jgi:hypothetical protein
MSDEDFDDAADRTGRASLIKVFSQIAASAQPLPTVELSGLTACVKANADKLTCIILVTATWADLFLLHHSANFLAVLKAHHRTAVFVCGVPEGATVPQRFPFTPPISFTMFHKEQRKCVIDGLEQSEKATNYLKENEPPDYFAGQVHKLGATGTTGDWLPKRVPPPTAKPISTPDPEPISTPIAVPNPTPIQAPIPTPIPEPVPTTPLPNPKDAFLEELRRDLFDAGFTLDQIDMAVDSGGRDYYECVDWLTKCLDEPDDGSLPAFSGTPVEIYAAQRPTRPISPEDDLTQEQLEVVDSYSACFSREVVILAVKNAPSLDEDAIITWIENYQKDNPTPSTAPSQKAPQPQPTRTPLPKTSPKPTDRPLPTSVDIQILTFNGSAVKRTVQLTTTLAEVEQQLRDEGVIDPGVDVTFVEKVGRGDIPQEDMGKTFKDLEITRRTAFALRKR